MRYATNCDDSPPQPDWLHLGPPLLGPVGQGFGTNAGQSIRFSCKMHYMRRVARFLADARGAGRARPFSEAVGVGDYGRCRLGLEAEPSGRRELQLGDP